MQTFHCFFRLINRYTSSQGLNFCPVIKQLKKKNFITRPVCLIKTVISPQGYVGKFALGGPESNQTVLRGAAPKDILFTLGTSCVLIFVDNPKDFLLFVKIPKTMMSELPQDNSERIPGFLQAYQTVLNPDFDGVIQKSSNTAASTGSIFPIFTTCANRTQIFEYLGCLEEEKM